MRVACLRLVAGLSCPPRRMGASPTEGVERTRANTFDRAPGYRLSWWGDQQSPGYDGERGARSDRWRQT